MISRAGPAAVRRRPAATFKFASVAFQVCSPKIRRSFPASCGPDRVGRPGTVRAGDAGARSNRPPRPLRRHAAAGAPRTPPPPRLEPVGAARPPPAPESLPGRRVSRGPQGRGDSESRQSGGSPGLSRALTGEPLAGRAEEFLAGRAGPGRILSRGPGPESLQVARLRRRSLRGRPAGGSRAGALLLSLSLAPFQPGPTGRGHTEREREREREAHRPFCRHCCVCVCVCV
jgi:hypothetical protein